MKSFLILVFLAIGCATLYGQGKNITPPPYQAHEAHEDLDDMEDNVRFRAVQIIAIEPITVFWKRETKYRVDVGSYHYDSKTKVEKLKKGCFIAIYCLTHDYAYALYPCKE